MSIVSIGEMSRRLKAAYPDAKYALDWSTPVELLVATILAAQCTDERVNALTPALFSKYPDAGAFANADVAVLAAELKPVGLAPQKAKSIVGACKKLVDEFGGDVPRSLEAMLTLPGVGRKTANVVLVTAFQMRSGVIVDTHVKRIAQRLGLTEREDADAIELDLMKLVPEADWLWWPPAVILFGRSTCQAKRPRCSDCMLSDMCPKRGVTE